MSNITVTLVDSTSFNANSVNERFVPTANVDGTQTYKYYLSIELIYDTGNDLTYYASKFQPTNTTTIVVTNEEAISSITGYDYIQNISLDIRAGRSVVIVNLEKA